jgi:hypothetical protein
MKPFYLICTVIFVAALAPISARATSFGNEITIYDGNSSAGSWYQHTAGKGPQEDQEVEPGMVGNQSWDLEGFFLDGTTLTMVGGFNFKTGNSGYDSGDIFIDITGDVTYGAISGTEKGNRSVKNTFGYDYVLDLDFATSTFTAYAINGESLVTTAYYEQNQGSNPWRYESGGQKIAEGVTFTYVTGGPANSLGFSGAGDHNALSVSLAFLQNEHHGTQFTSHFTMGCGNDNLMGHGQLPAPEPATLILMGFGLMGLAGIGRKKMTKR